LEDVRPLEVTEKARQPWPNTYERSIALLSSPILPVREAARYTKSPAPGAAAYLRALRQQDHATSHTPERPSSLGYAKRPQKKNDLPMTRVQSLDFGKEQPGLILPSQKVQRLQQAQQYRQELLKQQPKPKVAKHGTATFAQCTFNLANILMGVGLLGLPYVYKVAGYYGGTFTVLTMGCITWYTSLLIGRSLRHGALRSFPELARVAFGDAGGILLGSLLYFELFSCLAIFLVSMGDHLHQLLPQRSTTFHMAAVAALSLLPTIVLRTPALLSYLSLVGTLATSAVVLAVLGSALALGNMAATVAAQEHLRQGEDPRMEPPYHIPWRSEGLTVAFGLVAYCFSGHAIIPSIYTSMERPEDFEKMVTYTFGLVMVCCLAVATSGYYMFGSTVQDQVTLSLQRSSGAVLAMQALTWLMILTAFSKITLTMFPLALGIEEMVAPYLTSELMVDRASAVIKLSLTALALAVAIFCPSFSVLCSLVGLICTMAVSVVFPAAAHWQLLGSARLSWFERGVDALCVGLGVVMAVAGTVATVYGGTS
jgi:solute carrier family 32 (vesicular inhibitory amino acid transporter)